MKKIFTSLALCAFISISYAHEVPTLTIDDEGHFVLTIPYLEFKTEKGKPAFRAKLYSSTVTTFEVDFDSVHPVVLQQNESADILATTAVECEVLSIYDGDTMTVQCLGNSEKTKVRLYCIDTPERDQIPWGTEARDHLRSVTGKTVKLVEIDEDIYGRTVGEVYSDNINLNLAQVKAGKAAVYDAFCEKPEYQAAETEAKEAQLGIWAEACLHQTPWEWRKQQ
jgi:endonuclease YncB( thermonuclease family)